MLAISDCSHDNLMYLYNKFATQIREQTERTAALRSVLSKLEKHIGIAQAATKALERHVAEATQVKETLQQLNAAPDVVAIQQRVVDSYTTRLNDHRLGWDTKIWDYHTQQLRLEELETGLALRKQRIAQIEALTKA